MSPVLLSREAIWFEWKCVFLATHAALFDMRARVHCQCAGSLSAEPNKPECCMLNLLWSLSCWMSHFSWVLYAESAVVSLLLPVAFLCHSALHHIRKKQPLRFYLYRGTNRALKWLATLKTRGKKIRICSKKTRPQETDCPARLDVVSHKNWNISGNDLDVRKLVCRPVLTLLWPQPET